MNRPDDEAFDSWVEDEEQPPVALPDEELWDIEDDEETDPEPGDFWVDPDALADE